MSGQGKARWRSWPEEAICFTTNDAASHHSPLLSSLGRSCSSSMPARCFGCCDCPAYLYRPVRHYIHITALPHHTSASGLAMCSARGTPTVPAQPPPANHAQATQTDDTTRQSARSVWSHLSSTCVHTQHATASIGLECTDLQQLDVLGHCLVHRAAGHLRSWNNDITRCLRCVVWRGMTRPMATRQWQVPVMHVRRTHRLPVLGPSQCGLDGVWQLVGWRLEARDAGQVQPLLRLIPVRQEYGSVRGRCVVSQAIRWVQ